MRWAEVEDADLVRLLRRDPHALEEFYRRHVRVLTAFARRRLGDEHAADDLVASVFLAAIDSSGRYDARRGGARSWLFGITSNLIADQRRRSAVEARATARLSGLRPLEPDDYLGLDAAIDAQRATGARAIALARLPNAERELLDLLIEEQLTVSEAAAALGIRPGTARMRLARARSRLMDYLRQRKEARRAAGP